jgi:hypothetical protein
MTWYRSSLTGALPGLSKNRIPLPSNTGTQVDHDLVEQPGLQALLHDGRRRHRHVLVPGHRRPQISAPAPANPSRRCSVLASDTRNVHRGSGHLNSTGPLPYLLLFSSVSPV